MEVIPTEVISEGIASVLFMPQFKVELQLLAPKLIVQLDAVRVPDIVATATTVIFVQGLQLLPSFDSVMVPAEDAFVLSAQALIDLCPVLVKDIEYVIGALPPPADKLLLIVETGERS